MESGEESLLIKKTKGMEGEAFVLGGGGGKEILLKVVIQTILFFCDGCV